MFVEREKKGQLPKSELCWNDSIYSFHSLFISLTLQFQKLQPSQLDGGEKKKRNNALPAVVAAVLLL